MRRLHQADFLQDAGDAIEPMAWTTTEAIETFLEFPVDFFVVVRITNWRTNDRSFIVGKHRLTKRVLAITLLKNTFISNCLGSEEAERRVLEHRCITLRLAVNAIFMITEDNDAGFGTMGVAVFVRLDY